MKFTDLKNYNRILILGICGAGKSTMAQKIHETYGHPLIHLDQEFWQPGWVQISDEDWAKKVDELVSGDSWVIDGNFVGTLGKRLPYADCVIHLDFNRFVAIYRVLKRVVLTHGTVRDDMAEGCPEMFDFSFLQYIWSFPSKHGALTSKLLSDYGQTKPVGRLCNPKQVNTFLEI